MDAKSAFLNGILRRKSMWSNHWALKIKNILTMVISSIRRSVSLSRLLEHDMNVSVTFSAIVFLRMINSILPSSLERLTMIYSFAKFMLIT
jgi:hypothetical protein